MSDRSRASLVSEHPLRAAATDPPSPSPLVARSATINPPRAADGQARAPSAH